jgi:hypothetical protein
LVNEVSEPENQPSDDEDNNVISSENDISPFKSLRHIMEREKELRPNSRPIFSTNTPLYIYPSGGRKSAR